ncbi:RNA-directed DNA polymerase, eukaryota [Tanacetum coccineum]
MEALHVSFTKAIEAGIFKGLLLPGSISISHLFYADDAMFLGEWSADNIKGILNILKSFYLASGLRINISKSQLLGVGVSRGEVERAACSIGCSVMDNQFRYLGVMIGQRSSRINAWEDILLKIKTRLSKWKIHTLSIGGRLTLLKSVLGASPIYNMSIFKVPRGVLKLMERIRSRFFNGANQDETKITWVSWDKVLASKKHGGLGVSSYFALNRALLLKWMWRFISDDGSLWCQIIRALYGPRIESHSTNLPSNWCSILREVHNLKSHGFDFWSHCRKRIGNGTNTRFWLDCWIGNKPLHLVCPRLFMLELDKDISVADKMNGPRSFTFRRPIRGGIESQQMDSLNDLLQTIVLSDSNDRWVCDLAGDGSFCVKDIRNRIDDVILPSTPIPTRWLKIIPIKVNIFMWRARLGCLPTRDNLVRRGVLVDSTACPSCSVNEESVNHTLFCCDLARTVLQRICRWWNLALLDWISFQEWHEWFLSIRMSSTNKLLLEGVFSVAWWILWRFRNRLIFEDIPPKRSEIFDDIVLLSFNWCSNRCRKTFSWTEWLKNPHCISL